MMWHEARKQEKKIRGMIVDYHRRAERRRDYYEKIKADPTQFLQIHGRPCKIHLDPAVAAAGDSPANMMPWQGQVDTLIDRFDVRAHLDIIPQPHDDEDDSPNIEERQANYERYRILVQNEFLGVPEEKFLRQLYLEEQFGPVGGQQSKEPPPNPDKKGKKVPGAAIGYVYDDDGAGPAPQATLPVVPIPTTKPEKEDAKTEENAEDDDEDSDVDFDMCLDISKIDTKQAHEMNHCGLGYGMSGNDFFSFLTDDFEEQEALKLAREQEEEKAMFAGRKSRRERRAFREKKLVGRKISPPSYATRSSPTYDPYRMSPNSRSKSKSQSRSRSTSPVNTGVIQYITCFGDEEEGAAAGLTAEKHINKSTLKEPTKRILKRSHSLSSDCSSSRRLKRRSRSRSRSRSHSRSRSVSRSRINVRRRKGSSSRSSRSSSRCRSRSRSRSRKRSSSRSSQDSHYYSRRSRSRSLSRNRSCSVRRQRSCSSGSRSPSRSRKRSGSASFRNSRSPKPLGKKNTSSDQSSQPQQPVQRYYGRRKGDTSSSDLEASDTEDSSTQSGGVGASTGNTPNKNNRAGSGNTRPAAKVASTSGTLSAIKMTPQERLKKKMQALLNRQYKADKKAEKARLEKAEQERIDRKEELRELALKMRRRERQKRHKMRDGDGDSDSDLEDRSQWSSDDSDSHSDKSSPNRSRRSHSQSPDRSRVTESKRNKWDVPNRTPVDDKRSQREEPRKEERFKKEESYRRQDGYSSYSSHRKEDNYRDDGGSSYRRDEDSYHRDSSYYRRDSSNYKKDESNTYRRDDSHGGPSRFDSYNRRDFAPRRYDNDAYRSREDTHYRGAGRGDWNRKEESYSRPRYGGQRREDDHHYEDRRSESSRPKLVDY